MSKDFIPTDEDDLDDELRPEYDLSQLKEVGRGLYVERYWANKRAVRLDPDVWQFFNTDEAVNQALRLLIQLSQRTQQLHSPVIT